MHVQDELSIVPSTCVPVCVPEDKFDVLQDQGELSFVPSTSVIVGFCPTST